MTIVHHFQWDFHLQSFQFQIYCKKRKKKKKEKLIKLVVASKRNINLFMSQIWRPTEPFKRRLHDPINGQIVEYSSGKKSKGMLVSGSPSFLFHLIFFFILPRPEQKNVRILPPSWSLSAVSSTQVLLVNTETPAIPDQLS